MSEESRPGRNAWLNSMTVEKRNAATVTKTLLDTRLSDRAVAVAVQPRAERHEQQHIEHEVFALPLVCPVLERSLR